MTTDKNREVALALGLCWHAPFTPCMPGTWCTCGSLKPFDCCPINPDFTSDAGAVQLLRLMMKRLSRDDFFTFIRTVGFGSSSDDYWYIYGTYITTKGKLLEAVWLWRREHPK